MGSKFFHWSVRPFASPFCLPPSDISFSLISSLARLSSSSHSLSHVLRLVITLALMVLNPPHSSALTITNLLPFTATPSHGSKLAKTQTPPSHLLPHPNRSNNPIIRTRRRNRFNPPPNLHVIPHHSPTSSRIEIKN